MKLSWLYKEYINNNQYRVNCQYPGNGLLDFLIVNNIFYEQQVIHKFKSRKEAIQKIYSNRMLP
jgi:hypothetical protein